MVILPIYLHAYLRIEELWIGFVWLRTMFRSGSVCPLKAKRLCNSVGRLLLGLMYGACTLLRSEPLSRSTATTIPPCVQCIQSRRCRMQRSSGLSRVLAVGVVLQALWRHTAAGSGLRNEDGGRDGSSVSIHAHTVTFREQPVAVAVAMATNLTAVLAAQMLKSGRTCHLLLRDSGEVHGGMKAVIVNI